MACCLVAIPCGRAALTSETLLSTVGNWSMVVAAVGIAAYRLRLRGRVRSEVKPTLDRHAFLDAHAESLRIHARLCRSVLVWYWAPLATCLLMIDRLRADGARVGWGITLAVLVSVCVGVRGLKLHAVRRVDARAEIGWINAIAAD